MSRKVTEMVDLLKKIPRLGYLGKFVTSDTFELFKTFLYFNSRRMASRVLLATVLLVAVAFAFQGF